LGEFNVYSFARVLVFMVAILFAGAAAAQPRPGGGGAPGNGAPGPAPSAPSGLIVQFNAQQIAQLFSAAGFASEVYDNKVDDKTVTRMVRTQFWPNDTATFGGALPIWCKTADVSICNGASIFVNLGKSTVDARWINAWNNQIYFVRAYTLDDGSLIFKYDLMLQPGVTPDYLKTAIAAFKAAVDMSTDFKP
jgi:hypothetical protein